MGTIWSFEMEFPKTFNVIVTVAVTVQSSESAIAIPASAVVKTAIDVGGPSARLSE
jgi:hypothetical protein